MMDFPNPITMFLEYMVPSHALTNEELDRKNYRRLTAKYPGYIPVIVKSPNIQFLRTRYIVSPSTLMSQFLIELRQNAPLLRPEEAIFLFINDEIMTPLNESIRNIYYRYRQINGFLYITATKENTFG